MKRIPFMFLLALVACSTSAPKPVAPAPAASTPAAATTPVPLSRTNPNIVEETDTYYIERLPKKDFVRVDDSHARHVLLGKAIEFFKEDADYFYISVQKVLPEEAEAARAKAEAEEAHARSAAAPPASAPAVSLSEFEDFNPPRVGGRLRLQEVKSSGLPDNGMWRASFVLADVNGDGIPDVVSPPSRIGDGRLHVWIGDGKGHFSAWPIRLTQDGKPVERGSVDYGSVAVGDIDGDGKADIVTASHTAGLNSFFGDGAGGFEMVRTGLPRSEFSAQAIALVDADGDGRLDLVASRDILNSEASPGKVDLMQIRVYLFQGREKGWLLKKDGLTGGFYSNSLTAWDYDRDGKLDILTGSNYVGALSLLWKNMGDGTFSRIEFPEIELYAFHFATAPGTFGAERAAAFADAFLANTTVPTTARAGGVSVYSFADGKWTRHRVWRKKDPKTSVYTVAMGDLDGDGLDDVVFPDGDRRRLRIFFQQPDGSFVEAAEDEEPVLDSPGQCVRLADLNGNGRLDVVLSKTISSMDPRDPGGWQVFLNKR